MGEATWLNISSPVPYVVKMPVGEKPTTGIWKKIETSSDTVTANSLDNVVVENDGFGFSEDVDLLQSTASYWKIPQTRLWNSVDVYPIRWGVKTWRQKQQRSLF